MLQDVGGGRTWLTLDPDPAAVRPVDITTLRQVLAPALPRGLRPVEDFERAMALAQTTEPLIV